MENQTEKTKNSPLIPTQVEEVLRKINQEQNEKGFSLQERQNMLEEQLNFAQAKEMVAQQDYTDYLKQDALKIERIMAFAIDIATIGVFSFFVLSALLLSMKTSLPQLDSAFFSGRLIELGIMTFLFNYFCYFTLFEGRRYSTIGKHLMNIKVIDEFGASLSHSQSLLRAGMSLITFGNGQDLLFRNRVVKS